MHDALDFCGEPVPLDNFDTRERFDRELHDNAYKYGSLLIVAKMSHRVFPIIEPILAEQGVPQDFKYLAIAESALREATSPAGARGIWQFMPATARENGLKINDYVDERRDFKKSTKAAKSAGVAILPATARQYGLIVNEEVDERLHLEKETVAACQYLKDAFRRYNNWTLTAASYNAGMGGVSTAMQTQRGNSYYDISMTDETNRYIFRILAFKEIMHDIAAYGYFLDSDDYYAPLDTSLVEVTNAVPSLGDFAQQYGISYRTLRALNPWIQSTRLTNANHHAYLVKILRK